MALSDLEVFSEYAYYSMTEVIQQQVELFNSKTRGAIVLESTAHQGDYSQAAFFKAVTGGIVRRRNAYGSGAVASKNLEQVKDVSVKVAGGSYPMRIDPGQFRWIQQNPQVAGTVIGQQMAVETFADMLNNGLGVVYTSLANVTGVVYDATANTAAADKLPTLDNLNNGKALFGDRSDRIVVWVMHSNSMHKLYGSTIANGQNLFSFGSINIRDDGFGNLLVMTDSPSLFSTGTPNKYRILGLVPGAVTVGQNNDFDSTIVDETGYENIQRTYQAEWSYNVGVKGFAWNEATGGPSPTNAALFSAANWTRYATDVKNLAGVVVTTN